MDFDNLYSEYSPKIFRVCLSYLNDVDQAHDLTQETFISVWQNLHTFQHKSDIGTWIYRIACNKCLRQIQRDARMQKAPLPARLPDVETTDVAQQQHLFLRNCISELPELERIVIGLFLEDIPQEKIAEITGLSHANVRVKIHRIKEKLTQKFNDHGSF